jgi:hypothetical protein
MAKNAKSNPAGNPLGQSQEYLRTADRARAERARLRVGSIRRRKKASRARLNALARRSKRRSGRGANAKRIADAVSAYIEKPKRLHLRFVAPKGVNAIDVLARKPSEILESLEVEASADR